MSSTYRHDLRRGCHIPAHLGMSREVPNSYQQKDCDDHQLHSPRLMHTTLSSRLFVRLQTSMELNNSNVNIASLLFGRLPLDQDWTLIRPADESRRVPAITAGEKANAPRS